MYTMYTRPLSNIILQHGVNYHCYADDTQLYVESDDDDVARAEAIHKLEQCIADVCRWMNNNALKLNHNKTELIIFTRKNTACMSMNIGTSTIQTTEHIKVLGVTLDSNLNYVKQISNACRNTYMHLRRINSIRRYLPEPAVKTLVQSVALTGIDYCNSLYIGLPKKSLRNLQLAQNSAARLIRRTQRHEHITPVLEQLNWLTITKQCQKKVLVLTYKALHHNAPSYLCDLLHWYQPARNLRSSLTTSLVPNRNRTITYSKRLIDTAAAALWNSLPNDIRNASNIILFKQMIKHYLAFH